MKNKICLVTGGSRGIGKGIVKKLSEKGYKVAFTFNTQEQLAQELENKIKKLYAKCEWCNRHILSNGIDKHLCKEKWRHLMVTTLLQ